MVGRIDGVFWRLVFGFVMVVASVGAVVLTPSQRIDETNRIELERVIPVAFGGWHLGADVVPVRSSTDVDVAVGEIFEQVVQRTYLNEDGEHVMLLVGWVRNQSGTMRAHPQEVCYRSQGAEIQRLTRGRMSIGSKEIPVTRMEARSPGRREPVTYWYTVGQMAVGGPVDWLLAQLGAGLRGYVPDGLLVRVSSVSGDVEGSFVLHEQFVQELVGSLPCEVRWRFVGSDGAGYGDSFWESTGRQSCDRMEGARESGEVPQLVGGSR